ncbi:WYL domain-containing protein [Algoriphagus marincola]|uniref:WYL domain-containing protein n=1 Tax=Algoriphagus marincola TaxID=264027 RepID=A0ABS7N5I3_9BACT|nr:WYL domain-containing protein [Algoriphagus marincola]MBY5951603.1 WYL domain-containing protein [Algoriphagus marincola]
MSKHGTIRRYTLIIEKIGRKQYPSFGLIKDYLFEHGFEVSTRTIQRDIEQIRFEFGIEIKYDRNRNGYFIDTESSINPDSFFRFLEIVNTAELLTESLKESKDTLDYISFESHGDLRGVENLKPLLFAIKTHRKIAFTHENFDTGKQRKYTVRPYLLKEYQNRWYLIGIIGGTTEFRTFGVDRIFNLKVKDEIFKPEEKINPAGLFEHTVGLTYSFNKLEEVILSFTPLQAKYVRSLPLHKSQELIVENEKEVQIKLRIIPNFEFKQKIMMLGDSVEVLKPKWLIDEIKESLTAALKKYH